MNYAFADSITTSFQDVWARFVSVIPNVVFAIIVFLVGTLIAIMLEDVVRRLVNLTKIDSVFKKSGIKEKFEKMGFRFSIANIVAWVVKWFLIIVVLIATVELLHLDQVSIFLRSVALYLPNVIIAVVIVAIGVAISIFIYDVVVRGVKASRLPETSANILAMIAKWAIIIFAFLVALDQLHVASNLIHILFTGIIAGGAIAFGLAFGLGGKEKAAKWLDKLENEVFRRNKK